MAARSAEELVTVLNVLDVPKDAVGYYAGEDGKNYAVVSMPQGGDLLIEIAYDHNGQHVGNPNTEYVHTGFEAGAL